MTQSPYGPGYDAPTGPQYPATPPAYPGDSSYPGAAAAYPSAEPAQAAQPGVTPAPAYPSTEVPAYQATPGYPGAAPAYPGADPAAYQTGPAYPSAPAPYPPAPAYPSAGAYAPPMPIFPNEAPPKATSPVLGIVGLAIVVITGIIFCVTMVSFYSALVDLLGPGIVTGAIPDVNSLPPEALTPLGGQVAGIMISSLVGIVGLVISIIATVQKKGRPFAIIGIVLGVLAPLIGLVAAASTLPL